MANVYLRQAIRMNQTDTGVGPNFEYAATCCQGWRNTQEDMHVVIPYFEEDASLFAVFDGHNGVEVAQYAAKYLPEYIRRNKMYKSGNIIDGLREAFMLLDDSILLRESEKELREIRRTMHPNMPELTPGFTSGSTAVVCLLKNGTFYCANVGDSRCVLCRNGRAWPLSRDTKPEDPVETARIQKAGGIVINGRINMQINVSRAFGDHHYKRNPELQATEQMIIALPEVVVQPFCEQTDQFMVLMCDGIWNAMDNDEVVACIARRIKTDRLDQIAEDIVQKILPKEMPESGIKGKDNMTLMIVKFGRKGAAACNSKMTILKK